MIKTVSTLVCSPFQLPPFEDDGHFIQKYGDKLAEAVKIS